jgi:hypothetical protein
VNTDDFMSFLAAWALVHETADEGWKAAVKRGASAEPGEMGAGPEAFVDGLSSIIAQRKEELKAELARAAETGEGGPAVGGADVGEHLDELRFEVAELRGRLESLQAGLDALLARDEPAGE